MNKQFGLRHLYPSGQFYFVNDFVGLEEAEIVILGLPWDSTTSNRPGARFGPPSIRREFSGLESFSPYLKKDIEDIAVFDAGDVELPFGNSVETCKRIESVVDGLLEEKKKVICLGGEHLLSYPVIKSYHKKNEDLFVFHLDAHADLRCEYLGERLSHATVMNLVHEFMAPDKIMHLFMRSGTREEWQLLHSLPNTRNLLFPFGNGSLDFDFSFLAGKDVYLSLDLDVFDPSLFPGTGTPEPGGIYFQHFMEFLLSISCCNVVGADIMELSPPYDHSGISSALACKVLREIMCIMVD